MKRNTPLFFTLFAAIVFCTTVSQNVFAKTESSRLYLKSGLEVMKQPVVEVEEDPVLSAHDGPGVLVRADCEAGQTINPGEQCTYPGTITTFSVAADGGATFGFSSVGSGSTISVLNTTINSQLYNFVATGNSDGSWFLNRVGDDIAGTAGVTVSETALTVTEEDATGDTYTVVLDSEPTANVVVTVGGHSGTDVTPTPATLTFTSTNWETARTVTVKAGNDADTANDTVSLTHSAASTDSDYSGISITGVTVTVNDNDTGQVTGVMVEPGDTELVVEWTAVGNATGYKVQWKSGSQSYSTSTRQATIASGSTTSYTIASLTNGTEYTVRVTATRTGFNDGPAAEMTGTPVAPATAGVTVSETALTVTEEDATGDTYTVVLDSEPTANVVVTVAGHSGTDVTPAPVTLTFTSTNWETARTVTVTAGNDADTANDTVSLTHSAASTDSDYSGISIAGVTVTVNDNDTGQVTGVMVAQGNAQLVVNWTAVTNATGYKVQWKSGGQSYNTSTRQATIASGSTTSYTITSLTNDTEYTVQVTATRTGANDGSPSTEVTGTPESVTVSNCEAGQTINPGEQCTYPGTSFTFSVAADGRGTFWVSSAGKGGTIDSRNSTLNGISVNFLAIGNADGSWFLQEVGDDIAGTAGVTVSETALTVTEEDATGDTYTVVLDSEPTANVVVTVGGHSGTDVTPAPTTLTFTNLNWETAQTVTVKAGNDADTANDTVSLTHSAASTDSDYNGISIAGVTVTVNDNDTGPTTGICGRTVQVRDELLDLIEANEGSAVACADVTAAHLAAIGPGRLYLVNAGITALAAGDFDGLTSLTSLWLEDNSLTTLPAGVFDELTALTSLHLQDNSLSTLPDGVFDELTALTTLDLARNSLTTLSADVFDNNTLLDGLYLQGNSLTTLPADVFGNNTVLTWLWLHGNDLTTLPDGVFEDLTALTWLNLHDNPGAPFSPTADALPDDGTVPVAGGTVTLDGSGSDGGPWGTNVTYSWTVSGLTVTFDTFDDDRSAKPVVTIPALTAGAELTFTLTVTGRGERSDTGIVPDTDTATVTVTAPAFDPTTGICGRTQQVRDGIVALISGVSNCADVTAVQLAAVRERLSVTGITALAAGDFDGLTALRILHLQSNDLTTLPAGVFDELTELWQLRLDQNSLTTLPDGAFDNNTALWNLELNHNSLSTLPDDVFEELTRLTSLALNANPGAPFSPTAVALPDAGTVPAAGGTVTLDGSGSDGGPWGANVTYRWRQTSGPTSGVTFDDAASAKPVVTIPALTAGAELTFTLTVTGRATHTTNGSAPDTDTATVTAPAANAVPLFTSPETFSAAENQTAVGTVQASDSDTGDSVTGYAIHGGADGSKFSIDAATGVLTFASPPNFEAPSDADTGNDYVVVVRATSGAGARVKTADRTITVTVTDVAGEAPGVPVAPTVSSASPTSLNVSWTAPANAGPPIGDYDYRYRVTSPVGNWTEVTTTTITALGATITQLAENTEYDVQVQATNGEGTSGWSGSGSGSTDANAAPSFTSPETFNAPENRAAVGTAQASDSDTDDSVTGYAIHGGADRSKFSLVASTGVLTFASAPNFEAPADTDTGNDYVVVVRATSGAGERVKTADQTITVTVTDVGGEAPGVPVAPTVSSASPTSLTATWTAPANAGPAITDYDYQYRVTSPVGNWTEVTTTTITALSATITQLAENTEYDVQVQATNDEGTSGWSGSGSGSTDANASPSFTSPATFSAPENQTAVGTAQASDSDTDDSVTGYAIQGGADASKFSIAPASGVVTFASAPNFEAPADADTGNDYVVVVRAMSGTGERVKTADQTITVTVTDVGGEAPVVPVAPSVSSASATSLNVSWTAPANAGPPITDYDYRYGVALSGPWTEVTNTTITALEATIAPLAEDTEYYVQVRARNDEGASDWSAPGSGSTDANAAPSFDSPATFNASENRTAVGTVAASDSDTGDSVTGYAIHGGADGSKFSIDAATGVLTFASAPNFEAAADADTGNDYVVVVRATSGTGAREKTADQTITVTVTNVGGEAPGIPAAPVVSSASLTSVTVAWTAPANAGPAIGDYDYRYRVTSPQGSWTEVTTTTITGLSATITQLTEGTEYDVQVRATNDEGTSGWSDPGTGTPTGATEAGALSNAPENLQATAGDAEATLRWDAPINDSGADITGYAYRYKESGGDFIAYTDIPESGPGQANARSYTVTELTNGLEYVFHVRALNQHGGGLPAEATVTLPGIVSSESEELPAEVTLSANYPNPFNPETTIRYALPQAGEVRLVVYDLLGHEVAILVEGSKPAGDHTVRFRAGNLASGLYVYRLQAQDKTIVRTMILVK